MQQACKIYTLSIEYIYLYMYVYIMIGNRVSCCVPAASPRIAALPRSSAAATSPCGLLCVLCYACCAVRDVRAVLCVLCMLRALWVLCVLCVLYDAASLLAFPPSYFTGSDRQYAISYICIYMPVACNNILPLIYYLLCMTYYVLHLTIDCMLIALEEYVHP